MALPPSPAHGLTRLRATALGVTACVTALWAIHAVVTLTGWNVAPLGIQPRSSDGLLGIATAPLIHGSWTHLFSNTPALIVLGIALLYGTPRAAPHALALIWLAAGLGVWLLGRDAIHIGASGLTYGMLLFIFTIGILRRDRRSIALAILVFFLYGSMIWGVFPLGPGISFEYHLFGALTGIIAAFLLRYRDPLLQRRRYAEQPVGLRLIYCGA